MHITTRWKPIGEGDLLELQINKDTITMFSSNLKNSDADIISKLLFAITSPVAYGKAITKEIPIKIHQGVIRMEL
jgi:hypothetical protein